MCADPLAALVLVTSIAGCGTHDAHEARSPAAATASPQPAAQQSRSGVPRDLNAYRVVRRAETRQATRFALLRTPPEGLPRRTQRILRAPIVGMSWRLAQRIPVALPGAYWLVPGNRHLCVVSQQDEDVAGVGTNCATTADALSHGVASITVSPPGTATRAPTAGARLIVGVVPDGIRKAHVDTRDTSATLPVVDGVFVLRDGVAAPPDVITLR